MSHYVSMHGDQMTAQWMAEFVRGAGPRYLQIVGFLERAVADGRLRVGDRLPSQRQLAELLRVDLTTVTRAYLEAKRRQLIDARGALGTYVAAPKAELMQLLDLSMNIPPPPAGVDLDDLLKQGVSQVLVRSDADLLMAYHLGGGGKSDRAAGALWLKPILGTVDPNRIVVCSGAQSALAALILTLTQPGDVIVTEPLIYPGLLAAASQLGRRVVAVEADQEGMLPDALEKTCSEYRARLIYLNPTLQNPVASTMSVNRRRDIVLAASRVDARIIEDDPYWLLANDAPAPMVHFAAERVYYIATLSKCLTPGLRTAFVLLPDAVRQSTFLTSLRSLTLMSSPLTLALATQWIHDGSAARLLAGIRAEAEARQVLASQLLGDLTQDPHHGIHRWHALPGYWSSQELARTARAEGLAVTSSDVFSACTQASPPNAIRISLGGVRDRGRLAGALRKLSELVSRQPSSYREIVI